ncbi:MAG: uncharacterized protein QOE58_2534 [Actinomycetota bacterium]|jgi:uncharacterized protein YciI|nr:uncharacterized protein [Actinomycetota bacterium]
MSFFVLEYRYADMDARARVRPDHLAYARSLHDKGTIVLAGPVGDGSGAMMVLRLDSEDEVAQIIKDDPYTAAGVGVDHVLRPWNVVVPAQ